MKHLAYDNLSTIKWDPINKLFLFSQFLCEHTEGCLQGSHIRLSYFKWLPCSSVIWKTISSSFVQLAPRLPSRLNSNTSSSRKPSLISALSRSSYTSYCVSPSLPTQHGRNHANSFMYLHAWHTVPELSSCSVTVCRKNGPTTPGVTTRMLNTYYL